MSALPKAVQKQVDEANAIAANLKKGKVPTANPKTGAVTFEETPPDDANAPPPAASAAATPPAAPAGPAKVIPAGAPIPEESWEQRYKVLQGKYNAEVPRLQTQLRDQAGTIGDLRSQVTAMQGMMSSLAQRGAPAASNAPAPSAPAPTGEKLVKDEEVKSFGADLIDVMRRVVREEMHPHMSRMAPVAQRVEQVAQSVQTMSTKVAQTDQQRFMTYLHEHVPNLDEMNENPDFIGWLDQIDPYTGQKRQGLLDQAANAYDGPRVVAFFTGFQKEHAAVTPPADSTSQPPAQPAASVAPAAPASAATPNPLDRFVAPGAARAGAAGAPNEGQKRVFTRAEIQDFEMRRNSFVRRGKKVPDNLVQLEREIFQAASEGRVSA